MGLVGKSVLVNVLRNPQCINELSLSDWDLVIRQARRANLLELRRVK